MEVGDSFAIIVPIPRSMVEPLGCLGTAELQTTSVKTRAASWADCAKNHHHKQPGSGRENLRRSRSWTSDIQEFDAAFPSPEQAALYYWDNKRISIGVPRQYYSVPGYLSGAGRKAIGFAHHCCWPQGVCLSHCLADSRWAKRSLGLETVSRQRRAFQWGTGTDCSYTSYSEEISSTCSFWWPNLELLLPSFGVAFKQPSFLRSIVF